MCNIQDLTPDLALFQPHRGWFSSVCQQPGSPGWPQQDWKCRILTQLFLRRSHNFFGHGMLTLRFVKKDRGFGLSIMIHFNHLNPNCPTNWFGWIWKASVFPASRCGSIPAHHGAGAFPRITVRKYFRASRCRGLQISFFPPTVYDTFVVYTGHKIRWTVRFFLTLWAFSFELRAIIIGHVQDSNPQLRWPFAALLPWPPTSY